jgi:hypothetical protein
MEKSLEQLMKEAEAQEKTVIAEEEEDRYYGEEDEEDEEEWEEEDDEDNSFDTFDFEQLEKQEKQIESKQRQVVSVKPHPSGSLKIAPVKEEYSKDWEKTVGVITNMKPHYSNTFSSSRISEYPSNRASTYTPRKPKPRSHKYPLIIN